MKKIYYFASSLSCPDNPPYRTTVLPNGSIKCTCPGWSYRKQHKCLHTRMILNNTADKVAIKIETKGKPIRRVLWDKPKKKGK